MNDRTTETAISEDAIKRAVLPFLRHFYRYRYEYRPGTDRAEFDAQATANANVRADVLLKFQKDDGQNFVCAIEATSKDKLAEVRFGLNWPYFLWDAAMWAALGLAAIFVFLFAVRGRWLFELGWQGMAGAVLALGGALFSALFFAFRSRAKYRYIYAVEQFKRYRTDEQWVALAVDVFDENDREGYEELRNQLIFNGFGLISVENDGRCQAVISPSRLGKFGDGRRFYDFIPAAVALENGLSLVPKKPVNWLAALVQKGWKKAGLGRAVDPMDRFMRSFFYQKAVFGFAFFIIGLLAWRSKGFRSIEYFSAKKVEASRDAFQHQAEDSEYLEGDDVFFADRPRAYLSPEEMALAGPDGLEQTVESDSDFVQNIREAAGGRAVSKPVLPQKRSKTAENSTKKPRVVRASADLCDRFSGRKGWLVQDNFFNEKANADARVAALRHRGLTCAAVRRSCLKAGRAGWVVFVGGIFGAEKAARQELSNHQKAEDRYGLLIQKLLLKKL